MGALRSPLARGDDDEAVERQRRIAENWPRLLQFPDPQLEREFAKELQDRKRRGTLLTLGVYVLTYFFFFAMSDGFTGISHTHIASRVLHISQVTGMALVVVIIVATWTKVIDVEVAAFASLVVVVLSLFAANRFRISRFFGGTVYSDYIADCTTAVCYDDTQLLISLAGSTSVTIIFAALRAAKSWVLVILTTLLYLLGSSFGLGPLRESDTFKICAAYGLLMCVVWFRSYTHEQDLRRQWLENRRLRLESERQARVCEEQQRWLQEVGERFDAMQLRPPPLPSSLRVASDVDNTKYMVPGHDDLEVQEHPAIVGAASEPNALLAQRMAGRKADLRRVRQMSRRIRDPGYGMREYFDDCIAAFPELELFRLVDRDASGTSSGRDGHTEYQRTFGALFAVYWLLRLDIDGRQGLSFGCDEDWRIRSSAAGADEERKTAFLKGMDWASLQRVADEALGASLERIEAMFCLTAIHDIMKMSALVPRVSPMHAPYNAYAAGDRINDHDQALAYVLEYYPHLLPSFACLPEHMRDVVLFTQTKMSFNHGWFVQAEGPPGAMLRSLKQVLHGASGADLAFYFVHWLTDLSGAEGTPLAGAEKLTRKFPLAVLVCFLWSMPFLQRLVEHSETAVMEDYLEARFRESFPDQVPPQGPGAVATVRLAVMSQKGAQRAVEAFRAAPALVRDVLGEEMALTGIDGQAFRGTAAAGGPAFLVYYGPALLQRCNSLPEMQDALLVLACIYAAGRQLWPRDPGRSSDIVTLEVGQLLGRSAASAGSRIWVLLQENEREAQLQLLAAGSLNALVRRGAAFVCLDLAPSATAKELEGLVSGAVG